MLRRVVRKRVMQQQIGFCSTTDGARIAYATVGNGPPLVVAPFPPCHLGLEWEEPRVRDFWEAIGGHHLVVRYDKHGFGLSERNRTDFSLDSEIRSIEAIVKQLSLKSPLLWGQGLVGGTAAIAYAVKFPNLVSRLILSNAAVRGVPSWGGSTDSLRGLALSNWRMATVALAEATVGSVHDAAALQWYVRMWQEGVAPEIFAQLMAAMFDMDLRDLLPRVSVPTLVVHCRNNRVIAFRSWARSGGWDSGRSVRPIGG
jgi:pimeloyl-ACP methyl ester carboxylesterase